MPQVPTYLTPPEVARRLGVADQTVRDWCKAGRLKAIVTPTGRFRIPVEAIEAIERGEQPAGAA